MKKKAMLIAVFVAAVVAGMFLGRSDDARALKLQSFGGVIEDACEVCTVRVSQGVEFCDEWEYDGGYGCSEGYDGKCETWGTCQGKGGGALWGALVIY